MRIGKTLKDFLSVAYDSFGTVSFFSLKEPEEKEKGVQYISWQDKKIRKNEKKIINNFNNLYTLCNIGDYFLIFNIISFIGRLFLTILILINPNNCDCFNRENIKIFICIQLTRGLVVLFGLSYLMLMLDITATAMKCLQKIRSFNKNEKNCKKIIFL